MVARTRVPFAAREKRVGPEWINSDLRLLRDRALVLASLPVIGSAAALGAIALVVEGKVGNPIFRHERIGPDGKPFTMYKLHTLAGGPPDIASDGAHDSRATPVGRLLRRYTIDELVPLIVHVLRGNVAIFGSIPLVESEYEEMREVLGSERFAIWDAAHRRSLGRISLFGNGSVLMKLPPREDPEYKQLRKEFLLTRATWDVWFDENASPGLEWKIFCEALAVGLHLLRDPSGLIGRSQIPDNYIDRMIGGRVGKECAETGTGAADDTASIDATQKSENETPETHTTATADEEPEKPLS